MNKNAKGAVAIGAAALLLLGGGGTFALWNDEATISAGSVESGKLDLVAATGEGTWYSDSALTDEIEFGNGGAGYAIVPGDTVYWESPDLTVTAEGDNLSFAFLAELDSAIATSYPNLDVVIDSVAPTGTPNTAFVTAATIDSINQTTFNPNDLAIGTKVVSVDSDDVETETYSVVLAVTFDAATADQIDQDEEFDLADAVAVTLQQVILP